MFSPLPLFVPYSEEGGYLVEGLVLGLRHLLVREHPEDGQEHAERQEGVVLEGCLHGGEADAHEEVGAPVDQHGDGHGRGTGTLREELGRDHPRDGAGADGEEDHVEQG